MRNAHSLLTDILEAFEGWNDGEIEPTVDVDGRALPIGRATGLLWSCRDHMPNRPRRDVLHLIRHGETPRTEVSLCRYAQVARIVELRIDEARLSPI